jgi:hypothetical protein
LGWYSWSQLSFSAASTVSSQPPSTKIAESKSSQKIFIKHFDYLANVIFFWAKMNCYASQSRATWTESWKSKWGN